MSDIQDSATPEPNTGTSQERNPWLVLAIAATSWAARS
ncbi:hypothetical protein BH23CHL2_BH23CHL2_14520 [soil metagenome]